MGLLNYLDEDPSLFGGVLRNGSSSEPQGGQGNDVPQYLRHRRRSTHRPLVNQADRASLSLATDCPW